MDFIAEEELCQQADEVWRHYACPSCEGLVPPARVRGSMGLSSGSCSADRDGPCSVLPLVFFSAFADPLLSH